VVEHQALAVVLEGGRTEVVEVGAEAVAARLTDVDDDDRLGADLADQADPGAVPLESLAGAVAVQGAAPGVVVDHEDDVVDLDVLRPLDLRQAELLGHLAVGAVRAHLRAAVREQGLEDLTAEALGEGAGVDSFGGGHHGVLLGGNDFNEPHSSAS
jgi:hypothetical protein